MLRTVEFRDGTRTIPEYLAKLMSGLDTSTLTYEQAVRKANDANVRDYLNRHQQAAIAEHFRGLHR